MGIVPVNTEGIYGYTCGILQGTFNQFTHQNIQPIITSLLNLTGERDIPPIRNLLSNIA